MARFLVPDRVCLLVLVEHYLDGHLGANARLAVLSFLSTRIHTSIDDVKSTKSRSQRFQSGRDAIDGAFSALTQSAAVLPGRTVYDVFLQRLWRLDGLDAFRELFERIPNWIRAVGEASNSKTRLSRVSPLGQFVRRCCVEFTRLQFPDVQSLWTSFCAYRAPSWKSWALRHPDEAARYDAISASSNGVLDPSYEHVGAREASYMSVEDANELTTFCIQHLQKLGGRVPEDLRTALQSWIDQQHDAGSSSLQYFLAFFEQWKAGQYSGAVESLHRYFDYSLASKAANGSSDNPRMYYQYALLHLSVLHADFDCWDESVEAMDECIATARENQDTACLNFALSWLLYLRQAMPDSRHATYKTVSSSVGSVTSEQDELIFLKAKARETKHWSLLSSTLLEESKLMMYTHNQNIGTRHTICVSERSARSAHRHACNSTVR
ncbi:hypothetical protein BAUCODRAFT_414981 [Baudoinia panamericana UAMH 10762]|uniref:Anaphase-promoting complex subunit 5 n=1 Tax=Baudoinia panamericana (strain UAMH 10762) TaxID=717646 RepID=M2NFW4_BAUPA|nr:uncharacterized protein BAUCODRAFT_414981 [Baudoinia panamericana UAMH 10762]EMC98164.1 hypothetical protein BAUCODRAFT_414981 [Baudoinia panamericana UAMH 10762]